jgi:hypothetical protein
VEPSPGFEPESSAWEAQFRSWIVNQHCYGSEGEKLSAWGNQLFTYGVRYADCLFNRDFSKIEALPVTQQGNPLKELAALSKATHQYKIFRDCVKNSTVKWIGKSKNLIFADRLKRLRDPEEFWSWVYTVKEKLPDLAVHLDFLAVTGLRPGEGVDSYNLIVECARKGGLELLLQGTRKETDRVSGYYNSEALWLEHFWFPDTFLRPTKNAFVSFAPKELVAWVVDSEPLASKGVVVD